MHMVMPTTVTAPTALRFSALTKKEKERALAPLQAPLAPDKVLFQNRIIAELRDTLANYCADYAGQSEESLNTGHQAICDLLKVRINDVETLKLVIDEIAKSAYYPLPQHKREFTEVARGIAEDLRNRH